MIIIFKEVRGIVLNIKASRFAKNFFYAISSNLLSLVISTLVVLIIPKLIGVKEYGYWQLYLFYSAYVGFLHFGWSDGIYLRYGGRKYQELDTRLFFSQFNMMVITQVAIAIIISYMSFLLIDDMEKFFIVLMVVINMVVTNVSSILLFILQATNRIKEYSLITIISRVLYIFLIIIFLLLGNREYQIMILSDLIGKSMSLAFLIFLCKDIVIQRISIFVISFHETVENIKVGSKLMFANIASMLIIGVIRFGIEKSWDMETFGKVSLSLSVSNLLMTFINAIGIVIFPILKRSNKNSLHQIYMTMRDLLMLISFGILILYYPIKSVLALWLPTYSISLSYMALLFPISIFEGKMALLLNTYFKTLRKEKMLLQINIVALVFSVILTFLTTIIYRNVDLAILSILILIIFRSFLAEWYLSNLIQISIFKDNILECVMTLVFVVLGWYMDSWIGVLLYLLCYLVYIYIKWENLALSFSRLKKLMAL